MSDDKPAKDVSYAAYNKALEEVLPRNSDAVLEDQDCRSYTLQVIKEGLAEVELKLGGLSGVESTFTAPRSTFRTYLNK